MRAISHLFSEKCSDVVVLVEVDGSLSDLCDDGPRGEERLQQAVSDCFYDCSGDREKCSSCGPAVVSPS